MHKSRLAAIVIDCHVDDIGPASDFWSRALGCAPIPSTEEWASRYVHLHVPVTEPRVLLQKVSHPSRVHIDIETDDIAAEVRRLEALGARTVEVRPRWTIMEAPTGQRFCVVNPQRPDFATATNVTTWP
jgi:hypothetical protein